MTDDHRTDGGYDRDDDTTNDGGKVNDPLRRTEEQAPRKEWEGQPGAGGRGDG